MKAEQAKKLADQALKDLEASLQAGKSEALTNYLATLARFHHYSFGNVMLIAMQKPDATHVAGYRTWQKIGRFVKKGEKGIVIIAPMVLRKKDEGEARTLTPDKSATMLRFRAVYVFDVSQTDGEPLPTIARVQGDPSEHLNTLKAHIAKLGIELVYADNLGGAEGLSSKGKISIRTGLPAAEHFSVLVHELAHEMMHGTEERKLLSKTARETEAEAVAFVVTQAIGLETGTAASDYIQLYDGDTKTLAASLDRIQHAAADIIAAITHSEPEAD